MRVILADDHGILRDGLRHILEENGIQVVGEATTGLEAIVLARELTPDIVIMDISMADLNGVDATRRIIAELPGIRVIGLSMHSDRRYVMAMLEAGASGYLLKNAASQELLVAIPAVARGQKYLSPSIAGYLVAEAISHGPRPPPTSGKPLTPREREVLQLLSEGKSSKEIASALSIALPTVETHRRQLMAKLGVRSIAELTKCAIREGLTTVEP